MVKLNDRDGTLAIAVKGKFFKMNDKAALVKAVLTYTGVEVDSQEGRTQVKAMQSKIVDQILKNPVIKNSIENGVAMEDFNYNNDKLPVTQFKSVKEYAPYKTTQDIIKSVNIDFNGPKDLE